MSVLCVHSSVNYLLTLAGSTVLGGPWPAEQFLAIYRYVGPQFSKQQLLSAGST